MVENAFEYIEFLIRSGTQRNTASSYKRYLEAVSKKLHITINNETIYSAEDIRNILIQLKEHYADRYVSNCGVALRKYLRFVNSEQPNFRYPEEITNDESSFEGALIKITVNKYERKQENRTKAISYHGLNCYVCGFNFERVYGDLGLGFIHIHHTIPLHTIKKEYKINIKTDLVPVCPNCHAMLHRAKPVLSIKELRNIMMKVKR